MTIGVYPDVSLADARERADALRREVAGGANPFETKRRERESASLNTFQALADRYLNEHARRHKRSADADERNLRKHVLPKWADRRYDDIGRSEVIELVEGLVTAGKPTLANRVQALVSSIFSFAMDADLVKGNPCARFRRRGVETIGRRVLTDSEIRLFWPAIVGKPVSLPVGLALRLILLTGVRPGEAAGAAKAELAYIGENGRARWIIPAARSKNGRAHLVPLSETARRTILAAQALTAESDVHLFPSPSVRGAAITAHALAVAMASWRWQEDRDAVLNHTARDVGKKHYDLYDRERESAAPSNYGRPR